MKYNVNGNTEGVREAMLARLDALYSCELEEDEFLPRELMLQYEIEDAQLISDWLSARRGGRASAFVPEH